MPCRLLLPPSSFLLSPSSLKGVPQRAERLWETESACMFCTTLYVMHRSVTCVVVYLPVVRAARAHAHARRVTLWDPERKKERERVYPSTPRVTHARQGTQTNPAHKHALTQLHTHELTTPRIRQATDSHHAHRQTHALTGLPYLSHAYKYTADCLSPRIPACVDCSLPLIQRHALLFVTPHSCFGEGSGPKRGRDRKECLQRGTLSITGVSRASGATQWTGKRRVEQTSVDRRVRGPS